MLPRGKQDAARVLAEAGIRAASYRTVKRRLPVYATDEWRDRLSGACAGHAELGPSALVLYDVVYADVPVMPMCAAFPLVEG